MGNTTSVESIEDVKVARKEMAVSASHTTIQCRSSSTSVPLVAASAAVVPALVSKKKAWVGLLRILDIVAVVVVVVVVVIVVVVVVIIAVDVVVVIVVEQLRRRRGVGSIAGGDNYQMDMFWGFDADFASSHI
jgi:hypothetical protein